MGDTGGTPAGWYDNPDDPGTTRYWDGTAWTDHVSPKPPRSDQPTVIIQRSAGTNGMAIASLVLGILWIYWIGSILAVIFGHVAKKQLAESRDDQAGSGLATAGLVLGYIGIGVLLLVIIIAVGIASDSNT